MKHLSVIVTLVAAGISLFSLAGCDREQAPSPAAITTKPTPEESFALVAETLRRGIEDVQVGFIVRDASGHSRMTGKNRVTHKLIPPTNPGEQYRAVITIDSRSQFSLQRDATKASEEAESEEKQEESRSLEDPSAAGVEILNSDLVQKPPATTEKSAADAPDSATVSRRTNEDVHNFELVYQDGRWFLDPKTKFDPETEQSIQNAFDRALATQR